MHNEVKCTSCCDSKISENSRSVEREKKMTKNITSIKRLLMGIILLLLVSLPTGCAKTHYKHYEGPPLPDSELALFKASKKIRSIDGHSHRYGTGGKDFAKALTT